MPFGDSRKAIAALEHVSADLLIPDIFVPEVEGLETVKLVRLHQPEIPIIAVSGGGTLNAIEYLSFARRFGANATLRKPSRPAELRDLVSRLLATRSEGMSEADAAGA